MRGLRTFAALGLTGVLLLLLATPLCAAEFCPMGEKARAAGCKPLGHDCCQTQGERTAPSPLQVMPPAPLPSSLGFALAAAAEPALPEPSSEELAPPAILQGVGLYTFFAVFLI
ncbi:MAG TPA: hypothetical protein VGG03_27100 [Thermoanaerobaculia bacterium]|jgi:hypothetical protein